MTWLTTNAFPVGWYNLPLFQWTDRPQWFVTNTNTYAPGGVPNPYALAVTGGPGVADRAAILCTNKWASAGETVTFKLYVPGTGGFLTVKNAIDGSTLSTSGFSATVGWKDISVTVPAGNTAIQIELEDPGFANGVYPKYVLDEVASASIEDGGSALEFPPAMQMPPGWATGGTRSFAPGIGGFSAATYGSHGVLTTRLLASGETATLITPAIEVPAGGLSGSVYLALPYVSGADPSATILVHQCDAAGVEVDWLAGRGYVAGPGVSNFTLPQGTWRIRFTAELTNATQVDVVIDALLPESLWQVAPAAPFVPPTVTGWLATQALPRNWINWPINPGFDYPAGDPQPQWGFSGTGPYAPSVVGGAGVQGTEARLITNRFTVPPGGGSLQFEFYNTAVNIGAGENVIFRNRGDDAWTPTEYAISGFDKTVTGWQTVTLTLPAGINCLEVYVKRLSWASEESIYIIDEVTSALIKDGGDAVAFPPSSAIPPGWVNTGVVPWQFSAENGIGSVPGELIVYTGASGLATAPGDYAELLSHVFTVTDAPLSANCYVHLSYLSTSPNATFSIILCDEVGNAVQTLHTQSPANFTWAQPTFSIPVGTWSLRFKLEGDFTRQMVAFYLDAVEPDLLMQGGAAVETGITLLNALSAATASDDMTLSGIILAAMQSVATGASVSHLGPLVPVAFNSRAVLASTLSAQILRVMWASSTATGASSFDVQTEVAMVLQSLIVGQSHWPFPAENVAVWAVNAETGATTRYEGFDFNSYAKIGDSYFGCKADGIYQLDGDTDAGEPIRAMVSFGKQDFGTSALKRITNAYVGVSGQGRLFLKVMAEGQEYTYAARSYDENIQVQRFDTGKGLRVNWLEFELYNADGEDFELASVEFAVVPTSRRI